jgi:hypothetical protein
MIKPSLTTHNRLIVLTILISLFSCKDNKVDKRQNGIKRIVFATGGCFGPCAIQVIDFDSSLSVKYSGIKHTNLKGFHRGEITRDFWDSLNLKFESINYKELDSIYDQTVDDLTTELMIYDNDNKIKYIHAQSSSLPDSVLNVYNWLLKSIEKIQLVKTTDSLTFPTYLDRPPIRTIIKFLPPKDDKD